MTGFFQAQSALSQASRYIIAMGDSRTAAKTGAWSGWPVVNIAIDGSTSAMVLSYQVPQLAQLVAPSTIYFLDIGINDVTAIFYGGETMAVFQANAQAILTGILSAGAIQPPTVLVSSTTPFAGNDQSQYYSWFNLTLEVASTWKSLCTSYGATYVDLLGAFSGGTNTLAEVSPALYIPGGGHYSPYGWQLVDPTVGKFITPQGPL